MLNSFIPRCGQRVITIWQLWSRLSSNKPSYRCYTFDTSSYAHGIQPRWNLAKFQYKISGPIQEKLLYSRVYMGLYVNLYWQKPQLATLGSARALATASSEWSGFNTPCSGKKSISPAISVAKSWKLALFSRRNLLAMIKKYYGNLHCILGYTQRKLSINSDRFQKMKNIHGEPYQ